ncbi:DUF1802 domain-containing protein [[Phormidium ambiguum] IAM M-71]|uniref:DUF1802 domain-containing protein n=1 Tax=[Phormidium ambiguum] IAM M-71 TaxID=454136 RepID=A0A1U7IPI3_9CYAN|nr:DUF1802 family protein [Phormidium ambiguum]OKH39330.1 DUF1802 domain-containing protein [Phormidium ambiguum IAM M-71]
MLQIKLDTAIKLPVPDVEALIQGRMITAMPKMFITPGRVFALCPTDVSTNLLPPEQYYRSNFLPIAQTAITQLNSEKVTIKAWARCELCQMLDNSNSLEIFSQLTIWKKEALQQILSQKPYIFLTHLRVYLSPEPLEISANTQEQFTVLPRSWSVTDASPVMSETAFSKRRHQLENQIPPLHPELEELQSQVAQIAITNPDAEKLEQHIKAFLGWKINPNINSLKIELAWIKTINDLGNATTGGNYQKGTAFEQIVHKSLSFLGFEIDPNAKGGAGGMDLFCLKPYPLVGECKAGQGMPDATSEELIRIGRRHLGKETFEEAVKLIIGPGQPKKQILATAKEFKISIMSPMTLQELVELQAKYPGSVNLIELKPYLEAGQIDYKMKEYIDKVNKEIKLRSHLVTLIKNYLENTRMDSAGVEALHGAYFGSNPPQPLTTSEMREILIELSSPLTGYLGRKKGSDGSDRFYYLRDLPVK